MQERRTTFGTSVVNSDPTRIIASLAATEVALELKTIDLCFLAGLNFRSDQTLQYSFGEDELVDLFTQVSETLEPGGENLRTRASYALKRLRDQRMFARVDGSGIAERGDYALTPLAAAIVTSIVENDSLTRDSLNLLLTQLLARLSEILTEARKAKAESEWQRHVVVPLRVVVRDNVVGIERRQRGLDSKHEELRHEIADVISAEWNAAIDKCQGLLDAAAETLSELNNILLRGRDQCHVQLDQIQGLAEAAGQEEAQEAVQKVSEHVERVAAWGRARQSAWSAFYQRTHGFLRDVVRLDPNRALSQRLRDQISGWRDAPFFIFVAKGPPIRLLRPMESRVECPPVTRIRTDREVELSEVVPEDAELNLETLVVAALNAGASTLAEVTAQILPSVPEGERYLVAGRIAGAVARVRRAKCDYERPWRLAAANLEVEDWQLPQEKNHP